MGRVGDAQQETQNALAAAIAGRLLPQTAQAQADKLMARLETVTRVTLLGRPGSGKSAVLNLLAGDTVVPMGLSLCTMQVVYGEEPRATITLRDGSNLTMEGTPELSRIASMSPVLVKLELPLPALTKISLLEVVTSTDRAEQVRAIKWAVKQTDIAIWCTEDFDASEHALWQHAPDAVKDHAILVRTRADLLGKARATAAKELARTGRDDFAHFMAISAEEAHMARSNPARVDKELLKVSGATSLISTILRQIENGRQFAIDQAEILLHKYAKAQPEAPVEAPQMRAAPAPAVEAKAEPAEKSNVERLIEATIDAVEVQPQPVEDAPATDTAPEAEVAPAPVEVAAQVEDTPAPADSQAEPVETEAAPEAQTAAEHKDSPASDAFEFDGADTAAIPEQATPAMDADLRKILETATARLSETGRALLELEPEQSDVVLKQTATALSWINNQFEEATCDESPTLERLRNVTQDADDLIQLLRIEGGEDGATDAVAAMLQLKRGYQAELAA